MENIIFRIKALPKPRMTKRDKWLGNPNYKPRTRAEQKRQEMLINYWQYKDTLKILTLKHGYNLSKNELKDITFIFEIPKSTPKKKINEMLGKLHEKKPDLDNLVKAFQDCLLENDSHIASYDRIKKMWGLENMIILKNNL